MVPKRNYQEIKSAEWLKPADVQVTEGRIVDWHEDRGMGESITMDIDGERYRIGLTTILAQKLNRSMIGRFVRITYLGQVKAAKGGKAYQDFKVEVDMSEPEPNGKPGF